MLLQLFVLLMIIHSVQYSLEHAAVLEYGQAVQKFLPFSGNFLNSKNCFGQIPTWILIKNVVYMILLHGCDHIFSVSKLFGNFNEPFKKNNSGLASLERLLNFQR